MATSVIGFQLAGVDYPLLEAQELVEEVEEGVRKPYVNCMIFFHLALALDVESEDLA
jgi:hypothetical protein